MVRRKPIGISSRLGSSNSSLLNNIIRYEDIIEQANALRDAQAEQAYAAYNADMYPNMINVQPTMVEPIVYPTQEVALSGNAPKSKKIKYDGNKNKFVSDIYDSYYRAVRPGAASDEDAARQAKFLTQKAAFETGYGRSIANTHNYGGHRNKSGWLAFSSMDDFTKKDVALLDRKWGNWRNANNETDFVNAITTNRGAGAYAPRGEYQGYIGMNNDINQRLNMGRRRLRNGGQVSRPKAFLGAVIGAFGNIAGSLIQASQQEELARKQKEAEDRKYYSQLASNMSSVLNNRDAQEAYEKQFRMAYKNGGNIKITDGGYKIPIGKNTFLLRGGKHEDINETGQGGIGMKIGGKVVEGEDGELVQEKPSEVRIFSDSIGIDGYSFADLARMGYNKDKLFKIQQSMNGDYGRRRMRNGGYLTRPVERTKYVVGGDVKIVNGRVLRRVNYTNSNNGYWQDEGPANVSTREVSGVKQSGVRGTNYDTWKGRDGKTYYGTITKGKNGNSYNVIGVLNGNNGGGIRGNNFARTSNVVGYGTSKANRFINETLDGEQPNNKSSYARAKAAGNTRTLIGTSNTGKPSNGTNVGTSSGTSRRRLASRSATPVQTTLTPRTLASPIGPEPYYPDDEIIKEAYKDNELWEGAEQSNSNFMKDDDVDTFVPVKENSNGNRWGTIFKGSDWIQLGADAIGSLFGSLADLNTANNMVMPREPAHIQAVKLPTTYSIGADLADNNRVVNEMLRDSRSNTSSSMALNTMRNRIRLAGNDRVNSLYQTKSRAENEMLTADAKNQQDVAIRNAMIDADYQARLNEAQNRRALLRGNAYSTMLSGLSDAVGNFIDQGKQRYSDQQAMNYYMALLPEEGRNWLRRNRVDFLRRGGRIK